MVGHEVSLREARHHEALQSGFTDRFVRTMIAATCAKDSSTIKRSAVTARRWLAMAPLVNVASNR
jgi:hypothetical protein